MNYLYPSPSLKPDFVYVFPGKTTLTFILLEMFLCKQISSLRIQYDLFIFIQYPLCFKLVIFTVTIFQFYLLSANL